MRPSKESLLDFFKEVDTDFHPTLSEKTDLSLYADKILRNAILFCEFSSSGKIKGLVVMYANDYEKKYAYIPLVAVSPAYRRLGLGHKMLVEALNYVKSLDGKILSVGIHTNNPIAYKLYQKLAFEYVSDCDNRFYLEYHL